MPRSWDEWFEEYLRRRDYTAQTECVYRGVMRAFVAFVSLGEPGWEDRAADYKRHLLEDRGLRATSAALHVCTCRRFLEWLRRQGGAGVDSNPLDGVVVRAGGGRSKRRSLTREEAQLLLTSCAENRDVRGLRDYAIIHLMLHTGLRAFSVSLIDWEDFNEDGEDIMLRYRSKARSGKDREVIVPDSSVEAIAAYADAVKSTRSGAVFLVGLKKRLGTRQLRRVVMQRLQAAGLHSSEVTAHSLRHTFASHAHAEGATVREVQLALGQSDLNVTERYLHSLDRERKDAAERRVNFGEKKSQKRS